MSFVPVSRWSADMFQTISSSLRTKVIGLSRNIFAVALILAFASGVHAQTATPTSGDLALGEKLIAQYCTACHSVNAAQPSPHKEAPSFTGLSKNYPVEALAESLAEGIMTGHPDMPVFVFDAVSVDRIIAYLESIQEIQPN